MSAVVCGKRSFFEDLPSPPVSKRIRCSSSSPVRFSPFSSPAASSLSEPLLDQLRAIFPYMDKQVIEKALLKCGNDLDLAIKSLNELQLGYAETFLDAAGDKSDAAVDVNSERQSHDLVTNNGEVSPAGVPSASKQYPVNGAEWIDFFVSEMRSAPNIDDARARISRALEFLEKSIYARAGAEATKSFQENIMLKEQMGVLVQENKILKRAVAIQHDHQKEHDARNQELQQLKQLVSQYQEQLRTLEVNNYALTMHLKQAQQSSSIPGRFNPDVF